MDRSISVKLNHLRSQAYVVLWAILLACFLSIPGVSAANAVNGIDATSKTNAFNARKALALLSKVEEEANEWGSFAVSDILLVKQKDQFALHYTNTTSDLVEKARKMHSGVASSSDLSRFAGQLDLIVDTLPQINAGAPAVPGPALTPTSNVISITNIVLSNGTVVTVTNITKLEGTTTPAGRLLKVGEFSTNISGNPAPIFAALSRTNETTISERQAMEQGFSDSIYSKLSSFVLEPADLPTNQVVLFGIVHVSCRPGWRTVNDYIADLEVRVRYAKEEVTKDEPRFMYMQTPPEKIEVLNPSIYAVLPLTDGLQFDLSNRRRRELDLAGSLAATFAAQGMSAEARAMARYIRQRDFAIETASMLPLASTYTDGASFGFRIYPRPQGMIQPARAFSRSGNVLQPSTFPALIGFVVDRSVLTSAGYSHLRFDIVNRWIPVKGEMAFYTKAARGFAPNYTGGNGRAELSLADLTKLADRIAQASATLGTNSATNLNPLVRLAHTRLQSLKDRMLGYTRYTRLPVIDKCNSASPTPKSTPQFRVSSLFPTQVLQTNQPLVFALTLEGDATNLVKTNLDASKIYLGGKSATNLSSSPNGTNAVVIAEVNFAGVYGPISMSVVVQTGDQIAAREVFVNFPSEPKKSTKEEEGKKSQVLKLSGGAKVRVDGSLPDSIEVRPDTLPNSQESKGGSKP